MSERACDCCDAKPAKMLLPQSGRYLCGVCAHRLACAKDLSRRIRKTILRESSPKPNLTRLLAVKVRRVA